MNKAWAVFKREYVQAVRKKSFLIATVLVPILFVALMFIPSMMIRRGMGEKKIVVIDGTGELQGVTTREREDRVRVPGVSEQEAKLARNQAEGNFVFEYVDASGDGNLRETAQPWIDRLAADDERKIDGVLVISSEAITAADTSLLYYSRTATDLQARSVLGRNVNREIQKKRLLERGVASDQIDALLTRLPVESIQVTKRGEETQGGEMDFLVGFIFAALLLVPALLYGTEIMRGVVQEKSDRVVEILVSSMKPIQLLTGKVFGLAAVGLTQLAVWVGMAALVGGYAGAMLMASGDVNVAQFLRFETFAYFFVFYLLAYLLYVSVYAVAGAVSNNEKEAQGFLAPAMLFLMLPWFLMMPILMNPDSKLSVFLSLFPLFAPITMFVRTLVSEPPLYQVALAIFMSTVTVWAMFWATAKIFRVGILSYGKRPTIPELWRWMKVA